MSYNRFAIFIDGSNFYHTIRDLGLHVDYRLLLEHFKARGTLMRAFYYTTLLDPELTPDWLIRLIDWLSYNGFQVVTKQARLFRRRFYDEQGEPHWTQEVNGNVDIEIAVDMLSLAPQLDTAILFSGDGEFVRLVQAVQEMGCRVIVVSSEKTSDSTIANELRRQADEFLELNSLAEHIRMPERTPREPREVPADAS